MLSHRLRRYPNVEPSLTACPVFAGHTFIFLRKGGGSPANSVQTSVKERGFPLGGATPLPPIDPRLFQLGDIIAPLRSAIDTKWHFQHQKIV